MVTPVFSPVMPASTARLHRRRFLAVAGLAPLAPFAPRAARAADGDTPAAVFDEAVRLFFAARPVESAQAFDRLVKLAPRSEPELWQRGLALYYAERFDDGRRQFELHRTVNPADVENVAWHFACVARAEGAEAARKAIIPVGEDGRVPMKEIHALFAGRAEPAAVLAAAEAGPEPARRNQLCYAHQYLGLHAEALGDVPRAREHTLAAAGPFSMNHYMGKVAQVHARLRGWQAAPRP
jgi:lipoprotein NlpI